MSTPENIRNKAYSTARKLVRNRLAESTGAEYEKLGPTEKMKIDRAVEQKQAHIKKIALALIPQIAKAEKSRVDSFHKGSPLINHGSPEKSDEIHEELNKKFAEKIKPTEKPEKKEGVKKKSPHIQMHNTFGEEVALDSPVYKALVKKSEKSGIDITTIGEIYNRGMNTWNESLNVSQQQYAFARVNSFINQGKTYFNEDFDLTEAFGDEYHVLHINNKPSTKYRTPLDAKKDMEYLAKKHPTADLKLKKGTTTVSEATYQGKKVPLNKPMKGDVKKSKVYVDPDGDGKAQKVNFGDKNLSIKKHNPERKKSYCARSAGQGNLKDKTSANYWSRKAWNCEETDLEAHMKKHKEVMDKYGGKYLKTTAAHKGEGGAGYVTGHDPKKDGNVILTVNVGRGVRSKNDNPTKDISVNPKHLSEAIDKTKPSNREEGTDSLVKIYKKDTPGQDANLNESFNMAFDYQGKPTLAPTAHELMMKAQGGFAHHNDVQDVMNVTAIKEQIEKAFQATVLEEDKDELAISLDNLIDMVNEAFITIDNIKSSNIERDAWSQAQILKLERYIESVAAYIENMDETVRSGLAKPVVVPAHTKIRPDGTSITIPAKAKLVKTGEIIANKGDNPYDGK